jgi:cell division protein FtsW (lipid II flippase)
MPSATRHRWSTRAPARSGPAAGAAPPAHYLLLVITVAVLNVVGVVMVLSASSVVSLTTYGSAWYFFERQLIWTVLGAVAFVVASRIDYRRWRDWARPLLVVTAGLLVLVLVPHFGTYVAGSRRWLGIGSWRFQPTELAKLTVVLFAADLLTRREHGPRSDRSSPSSPASAGSSSSSPTSTPRSSSGSSRRRCCWSAACGSATSPPRPRAA